MVIANDTIVSGSSQPNLPVIEDNLEFVLTKGRDVIHRSGVQEIPTRMDGLKMFTLLVPIPQKFFRPVCLPPSGYISRMVKPSSCAKGGDKLLKVGNTDEAFSEYLKFKPDRFGVRHVKFSQNLSKARRFSLRISGLD